MTDAVKGDKELIRRLTMVGLQDGRYGPRILRRWQVLTVQLAKVNVAPHKRTGDLQRSIQVGPIGRTAAQVVVTSDHAGVIEHGSRPHLIRPRVRKVLAWGGSRTLSGRLAAGSRPTNFARLVRHPGTRADPFLEPAAKQALGELDLAAEITTAWNEAA